MISALPFMLAINEFENITLMETKRVIKYMLCIFTKSSDTLNKTKVEKSNVNQRQQLSDYGWIATSNQKL